MVTRTTFKSKNLGKAYYNFRMLFLWSLALKQSKPWFLKNAVADILNSIESKFRVLNPHQITDIYNFSIDYNTKLYTISFDKTTEDIKVTVYPEYSLNFRVTL